VKGARMAYFPAASLRINAATTAAMPVCPEPHRPESDDMQASVPASRPVPAPDHRAKATPRRRFGEPRPKEGEAPVRVGEVFFSRTDMAGTIQSGNEVFRRVTDHSWDDLIGAPHALTRHPDMPRGVYWLLWQHLGRGQPLGIYLKNRARDGLWYWVFAILTPVEGGFLSVQFKPTSPMLVRIRQEYADLLALEGEQALAPDASGAAFLARLADLGYPSYDRFMAQALAGEITARATALGQLVNPVLDQFADISAEVAQVEAITEEVAESFSAIRNVPTNLRILATRLEAAGGPISAISSNYATISDEIHAWTRCFLNDGNGAFGRIRAALDAGLFLQGAADIQDEALAQFRAERRRGPAEGDAVKRTDMALLEHQAAVFRDRARSGLDRVTVEAEGFARAIVEMKRLVTGLSSTRMLCKIEAARRAEDGGLDEIIRLLDGFQTQVERHMARFSEINRHVQTETSNLRTARAHPGLRRAPQG
ncbi:MAG: PAS domain-containing protein, partial [Pseudomonadota bacterium]